jgi:hypothetical protein
MSDIEALVSAFRENKCAETAHAIVDAINTTPELAARVHHSTLVAVFRRAGVFASAHLRIQSPQGS